MGKTTKTYAEFAVPGLLFPETEVVQVKSRDVDSLKIPEDAFGVSFFDILVTSVSTKRGKKVKAESHPVNCSRFYNIGTKICTVKEIIEQTRKEKRRIGKDAVNGREKMLREMEVEKLKYALRLRVGGYTSLKKGGLVILLNGNDRTVTRVK